MESINKGPYKMREIIDPLSPIDAPRIKMKTYADLTGEDKLRYKADINAMKWILLGIPNDIYNSVDACQDAQAMWKRVQRNHDPLALVENTYASPLYSRSSQPYYVTHPPLVQDYDDDYQVEIKLINGLFANNDHEQRKHAKLETIKPIAVDDQLDSNIMFDDPYVEVNAILFMIEEVDSSEVDTSGGASLSSTMIIDDEGVTSLMRVVGATELVDTSDYRIWEVIQNGNGPVSITTDTQGQIKVLPPRTAEEILARERERKARTTLLMALPEDHLAKFHKITDAKEMWEAIKSRFGGNDESKKMQKYILKQQFEGFSVSNSEGLHKGYDRFQSLLSQLVIHGAGVSTEDANQKFLRSLPSAWSQVSLITRTKQGVDSLSFDDLCNNLRVFGNDVKGSTASSSSTQNVAFVSENTISTNDVSTAYGVSNPSGYNSQYEQTSSYSLLANQSSCPQLDHEDLEQLNEFDLEEIDLKWQVAMISIRMKKFYKKTGRKLQFDAKEPVGFDKTKVECYNCHKIRHFARECRIKGIQDNRRRDAWNSRNKDGRRSGKQEDSKSLVTIDGEGVDWTSHSEEEEDYALIACNSSDTEVTSCSKECKESYVKLKKLYDEQRAQLSDASIEIQAYTQGLNKVEAQLVAHQQGQLWYEEKIRFMKIDLADKIDVLTYHKKLLAEAQKEKEDLKAKVEKWHNSSKNLGKLLNTQMSANDKFGLGYGDHRYDGILSYENEVLQSVFMNKESELVNQPLYDRFVTAGGMHVVPPPMTGNYMPSGPDVEIDYSQFTYGPKQSQPSESETQTSDFDTCESDCSVETHESLPEPTVNEPKVVNQPKVWSDAPIIEEYESDSEDEHVSQPTKEQEQPSFASTNKQVKTPRETVKNQFTHSKNPTVDKKGLGYGFTARACFVCGSLSHLIRDCDFHEKRMAKQAELNNSMRMKSSQREIRPIWNNVQRVNHKNQFVPTAVLTRTGKIPVNTTRASGTNKVSTARHDFNRQAVLTNASIKVNTVKPIVNRFRPANVFYKTHSPFSRSFVNTTALRTNFSYQKVNTVEVNVVSAVGGKGKLLLSPKQDYPHRALKHKGIIDFLAQSYIHHALTLVNVPVPLDNFLVNALTSKVFSFMVKKGTHFSRKVTPLFASMLVQSTEDEGATSERPSESQPTPSPPHPNEANVEPQSDPSPRPSPTPYIPDSILEVSGGNHGGQSSSDKSLLGNEGDMTLQSVYDICISLCTQRLDEECFLEAKIGRKEILEVKLDAKGVYVGRTRDGLNVEKEGTEDAVSTEDVVSTDISKVSTDRSKASTDRSKDSTDKEKEARSTTPTTSTITPTTTPTIFGDDETIAQTERPRPTLTRSLLTLKPLPKIDPKYKGKKKIKDEDESDTESEDILKAEKKFKRFLAEQRAIAIRNKPPIRTQLRNQMMTYLKHVGNKKHSDLKSKTFEEIQALYEKVKRFDESFTTVGSTEDDRRIKEMNEGVKDTDQKRLKEEDIAKVPAKVEEQGSKKRKWGHIKMISRKKPRKQSDDDSDDEHRKCLNIVTFEGTLDSEIKEKKFVIARLDKDKYVAEILKKFDFVSVKTASTPIETHKPLVKDEEASDVDVHLYRSMIGSLMYLTASRPDIMFAVCACSRFQVTPKTSHLSAVKRIFRLCLEQIMTGNSNKSCPIPCETILAMQKADHCGYFYHSKYFAAANSSIRSDLLFDDADGIDSLPNQAIFDAIQLMGYEGDLTVLTFNKALFSPQWRHLDAKKKFVMYPRFISIFLNKQLVNVPVPLDHFPVNALTSKVFSFMVKKGKHFSGKVTPLFASMLVQSTEDEGATSERPSEPQPTPSPPHPSEANVEPQSDQSPRPSPTPHIPDSIPEVSGGNHGGQSSSDKSLSGNEGDMTLQSVYDLCISLCTQVTDQAKEIKHLKAQIKKLKKQAKPVITHHRAWMKSVSLKQRLAGKKSLKSNWMQKESVSKQGRKSAKAEPSVHKDPLFDELDDDEIDNMDTEDAQDVGRTRNGVNAEKEGTEDAVSTEDVVSTDKEKVSTDRSKVSTVTDQKIVPIRRKKVLLNMSQAKAVSREKEKGVELKDLKEDFLQNKELLKRFDESFTVVGSTEDERRIKEMNEGVKDTDQKRLKEEDTTKVPAKVEVTEQGTLDSEIMEKKSVIARLDKVSSPDGDYLVIYRANGNFRAFNYLMEGDLKIMMESSTEENDQSDFWSNQQDWSKIIHLEDCMKLDLLQRMLDLGLEVERESTVALDLIRFIKKQIDEE
ncbi:ribonuclease H-like domain-containing protein [Tanacetum coccineum]